MSESQTFRLVHDYARQSAISAVARAPEGWIVRISEPTRSLEQSAALHALLSDIVKARIKWAGKTWDIDSWRAIFVSAHARAENLPVQTIPGIEGEFVSIRRSTTRMTKSELSSLIDYVAAWAISQGVQLHDTRHAA